MKKLFFLASGRFRINDDGIEFDPSDLNPLLKDGIFKIRNKRTNVFVLNDPIENLADENGTAFTPETLAQFKATVFTS